MRAGAKFATVAAFSTVLWIADAHAEKKTVCTITVNSADEKESFRRSLPSDKFQFVELVEKGQPNWLTAACRKGIRCDVLVISGHHDGEEFFSDNVEASEFLSIDEMERLSCSASCPGLFSQLKEVYLFGCNTLNSQAISKASADIARSLVRSGHSEGDAQRLMNVLSARHSDDTRDRVRRVFKNVPVIYGFSSVAPLGPIAASMLNRYFQSGGATEVGSGRASPRLLGQFSGRSMITVTGSRDSDPDAPYGSDVCRFSDDRLSPAQKVGFVHELVDRETAEVRLFLDRIEKYSNSLRDDDRQTPGFSEALGEISRDLPARARFLELAQDADQPSVRARMLALAQSLGWLSAEEKRAELGRMIDELFMAKGVGASDVDLVCSLNEDGQLERDANPPPPSLAQVGNVGQAAVLACLGSAAGRARMLLALTSLDDGDVQIAQVYLRHRPITDVNESRAVAAGIARMSVPRTRIHALGALTRQRLSDPETLETLVRQFVGAESVDVQTAIAGVLIRADYPDDAKPELVHRLQQHRLKSASGEDMIDLLMRRLQVR